MGHGNHLVQAVEVYKNKPVFYGLGNAVFDWYRVTDKRNGLLVRAVVSENKLSHVSFVPLTRDTENDPVLLDPGFGKGNDLYQKVKSLS
jgi:poly-gamma-glutamate synthesis protein (capsule biosynthesis protein)